MIEAAIGLAYVETLLYLFIGVLGSVGNFGSVQTNIITQYKCATCRCIF